MSPFLPFVLPIAAWVCWSDLSRMKIPNLAVLALLAVYVVVGPFVLPFDTYLWNYLNFAVVLVIGFILSTSGAGVGAGDSKFAAAMAPFIMVPHAGTFLMMLGAVTIIAFISHRMVRSMPVVANSVPHWESIHRKEFPMGLALTWALVLYLALPAFN
ncbi:MAG: prepilin peptidase [Pseudomonadota bacterium]